ncbi:MAG: NAD(P)/FAD-dependent oxidoreductase [Deltaproteobacteria bacterium]|nr:NAD(P)/FAD-dependent oxidoreductase [Deltaproteobacteria bacterium]
MIDFIVIGTGFSGLGMAMRLKREGRSFVVLEKAASVGGTWRENTYPGCACDVPSHLYSYSFEPHAGWTRMYAPQPEIRAYLEGCAEKYGVMPHVRFGREVIRAVFDERQNAWFVETATKETFVARYLVFGIGALHRPAYPKIAGLERFAGRAFHSARWDHAYDLRGKRVAVIGSGASAVQLVPPVVAKARAVTVFQRTPPWVLPKPDRPFTSAAQRFFAEHPWAMRAFRGGLYALLEAATAGFVVEPKILAQAERLGRRHIAAQISDAELRAKVTPDYRAGCKRILISDDYYPALAAPSVEVVTEAIAAVDERAVITVDGRRHEVDAIIFGTGFHVTDALTALDVRGRNGLSINAAWKDGIRAYLGTTIAGFPNAFMLMGPNTGLASNSMVFMIEAQIDYAMKCVREADQRGAQAIEVRANAQSAFNDRLQRRLAGRVWSSGCQSWYLDENGRNSTLWPGMTLEYWARTRRIIATDYLFDTLQAQAPRVLSRAS